MTAEIRIVAVAVAAFLCAANGWSSVSALEELRSANLAEVSGGTRLAWLLDHAVVNDQNEKVGTVTEFVVGRDFSLFVILQVGGFLGFDTYLVAVPFRMLEIDAVSMGIRLPGATRKALREFRQFHFPN